MYRRLVSSVVLVLALAGCATPGGGLPPGHPAPARATVAAWTLAELAAVPNPHILMRSAAGNPSVLATASLRAAQAAGQRLRARIPSMSPELLVAEGRSANAFAFFHQGSPYVAFNVAMVDLIGDDESAWAALIGHELAHLNLRHKDQRARRQAEETKTGDWLSVVLTLAGVPLGGAIAGTATTLAERGYSRDDEREADRASVEYLYEAGYELSGAVRLHEKLAAGDAAGGLPFLASHPSGRERVDAIRALIRELASRPSSPAK